MRSFRQGTPLGDVPENDEGQMIISVPNHAVPEMMLFGEAPIRKEELI